MGWKKSSAKPKEEPGRKNGFRLYLWEKALATGLLLAILFSFTGFAAQCEDVSHRVLRLHILANSDTAEDQELKLQVRDRILQGSAGLLDGVKGLEEAQERVEAAMPVLLEAAQDEISQRGYDYSVSMELASTAFNTRVYGDVTLPAGTYQALQVKIGEAEGKNWWCVLFPALCLPAAEDPAQLEDVLTQGEMDIVAGGGYQVRFKVLEWLEGFGRWVQSR